MRGYYMFYASDPDDEKVSKAFKWDGTKRALQDNGIPFHKAISGYTLDGMTVLRSGQWIVQDIKTQQYNVFNNGDFWHTYHLV